MIEIEATIAIGGDDRDVWLRGHVYFERDDRGVACAALDGPAEAWLDGEWVSVAELDADPVDVWTAIDALCAYALEMR